MKKLVHFNNVSYDRNMYTQAWKILLISIYIVSPIPAILLFDLIELFKLDSIYAISLLLGIESFCLICIQIFIASRPFALHKKTGLPFYNAIHALFAILIITLALIHRLLKLNALGFPESTQTLIGSIALISFSLISLMALVLFAPIFPAKIALIKKLRTWFKETTSLDYPRLRALHSIVIVIAILVAIHVALASPLSSYPAGALYLLVLLLSALIFYVVYRIKNRAS